MIYSFYCHNQRLENSESLRLVLLEMIRNHEDIEVLGHVYHTIARIIDTTKNATEFIAHFEILVYKFIENWSYSCQKQLFSGGFVFLKSFFKNSSDLPLEGLTYHIKLENFTDKTLKPLINNLKFPVILEDFEKVDSKSSEYLGNLTCHFTTEK